MASSRFLISSTTLTGSQATVTFSSIPSTYTDLCLKISARGNNGNTFDSLTLTINGDSSALYSGTGLYGDPNTPITASTRSSGDPYLWVYQYIDGSIQTANTFGNAEIYIPSYTASQSKQIGSNWVTENNAAAARISTTAGLYRSNTAISSLTFAIGNGTSIVSGSSFYLYGLKNS